MKSFEMGLARLYPVPAPYISVLNIVNKMTAAVFVRCLLEFFLTAKQSVFLLIQVCTVKQKVWSEPENATSSPGRFSLESETGESYRPSACESLTLLFNYATLNRF